MPSLILNAGRIELPPEERNLLDLLRDSHGLTGAKPACRGGDCGACQVLFGERPPEGGPPRYVAVNACLLTTGRVAGGQLITVEGLNAGGNVRSSPFKGEAGRGMGFASSTLTHPHPNPGVCASLHRFAGAERCSSKPRLRPLEGEGAATLLGSMQLPLPSPIQQVLVEEGAVQCGYCTPGLVIALTAALLAGQPLLQGAAGNLCRCTGYGAIRRACERLESLYPRRPRTLDEAAALGWVAPEVAAASAMICLFDSSPSVRAEPVEALSGLRPSTSSGRTAESSGSGVIEPVAGETDWSLRHAHDDPQALWQLHRLPELRRIEIQPEQIVIGAAVTVAELQHSPQIAAEWPELPGHLELFASPAIRNSATVGGNLVNASPTADLALVLLALEAELSLQQGERIRRLPLAEFYTGYRQTRLEPGEWLREVQVPRRGRRLHCEKLSRRAHDDIATVNLALALQGGDARRLGEVRLAAGGVGPVPKLLADTSRALSGCALHAADLRQALAGLDREIAPIDDVRGSAGYKRRALRHLIVAALDALQPGLDWQEVLR